VSGLALGGQHHRPAHLAVVEAEVLCPLTGAPEPVSRCTRCGYLQGSMVGPDPCILCGAPPYPGYHRRRRLPRHASDLIFFHDWPDEDS
jgi:hypothetical protein